MISRPGQSQELLYKQPRHSFSERISQPFPPTALRRRHAQTVRVSTSSFKIDYVIMIMNFLNPEEHQNPFSGSKVTAILLRGWIWPIGGVSAGEGLPCSLCSRLFYKGEGFQCYNVDFTTKTKKLIVMLTLKSHNVNSLVKMLIFML